MGVHQPLARAGCDARFHARVALRDTLRTGVADDPASWRSTSMPPRRLSWGPWYRETVAFDRHRLHEMEAVIAGDAYEPDDPAWEIGHAT